MFQEPSSPVDPACVVSLPDPNQFSNQMADKQDFNYSEKVLHIQRFTEICFYLKSCFYEPSCISFTQIDAITKTIHRFRQYIW